MNNDRSSACIMLNEEESNNRDELDSALSSDSDFEVGEE